MNMVSADFNSTIDQNLNLELAAVLDCYRSYIETLPVDVRQHGMKIADLKTELSPGRLSVLTLPFLLGETFGIVLETQRLLSKANLFGLHHFTAQDNLVDQEWNDEIRTSLVILGTLCLQQMFEIYHKFFPPDSQFWLFVDKYWREWAGSLIWERQAKIQTSFSDDELIMAARKAAPLKICTTGIALLRNKPYLIPTLEIAVDKMHMVMQMADDLVDLEEDLAGNHYNTFLSMMEVRGSINHATSKDIDHIGRILFSTGVEQEFFLRMQKIAEEFQNLVEGLHLEEWENLVALIVQEAQLIVSHHLETIVPKDLNSVFISAESVKK
jgi:hypothetical protein